MTHSIRIQGVKFIEKKAYSLFEKIRMRTIMRQARLIVKCIRYLYNLMNFVDA